MFNSENVQYYMCIFNIAQMRFERKSQEKDLQIIMTWILICSFLFKSYGSSHMVKELLCEFNRAKLVYKAYQNESQFGDHYQDKLRTNIKFTRSSFSITLPFNISFSVHSPTWIFLVVPYICHDVLFFYTGKIPSNEALSLI